MYIKLEVSKPFFSMKLGGFSQMRIWIFLSLICLHLLSSHFPSLLALQPIAFWIFFKLKKNFVVKSITDVLLSPTPLYLVPTLPQAFTILGPVLITPMKCHPFFLG